MELKLLNCRPATLRMGLAALVLVLSWCGLSSAHAAPTTPSKAHQLQIGVPWSSSMKQGELGPGQEWLRLPEPMGPGDKITFASDADTEMRYCLVPAIDDFGAQDAIKGCGTNGYPSDFPDVDLNNGKYRRTLKWAAPESHGFLLAVGDHDTCCRVVTTVYSVLIERIDHYTPDFTPPRLQVLDQRATLNRRRVAKVRIVCPADEASPPCSGSVSVKTRNKVRYRGKRRVLTLGSASFSLGANQTAWVTLRLDAYKTKLALQGRKGLSTRLTARVKDNAKNRSTQSFNLRLVRR